MSEREPRPHVPERPAKGWDVASLAQALSTTTAPVSDLAYGEGVQLPIGAEDQAMRVELYPSAAVARLRARDAQVELHRLSAPKADDHGIVLEAQRPDERLRMTVSASGEVALVIAPAQPAASTEAVANEPAPTASAEAPSSATDSTPASTPALPVTAKRTEAAKEAGAGRSASAGQPAAEPKGQERQRVTIAGRVGAVPHFRTSPNGILICRFPLAVHHEGQTIWHSVLAFGARAEKLRETLKKGQEVEIVAYIHHRERRARAGGTRTVEELYAVAVRSR